MSIQTTSSDSWHKSIIGCSAREWCDRHGLIHDLTPFSYRSVDPWEIVEATGDFIDELPTTAATFPQGAVIEEASARVGGWRQMLRTALLLHGAWPSHRGTDKLRWVNPTYIHQHALGPGRIDDRVEHVRECARLGTVSTNELSARFGITLNGLRNWLNRDCRPFMWSDLRQRGRESIARTLYTVSEWTDRSYMDCARLLPVNDGTASRWMYEYALEEGFEAPDDPSARWSA